MGRRRFVRCWRARRPRGCDEAGWLEQLPVAVLVSSDGFVAYANRSARELFDPVERSGLCGRPIAELVSELAPGAPPRGRRRDGTVFGLSTVQQPVGWQGRPAQLHVVRNIDGEQALQQRLEGQRRALRALSGRLIDLQERERRSIARELHDEIGQCLSAIRVQFAKLQRRVVGEEVLALIDSAASLTERTLGRVRSLSLLLHPPQLETLGLVAALRWHLEEQGRLHGLPIHFQGGPIHRPVHADLSIAAYRIVQESVSNALRHAGARQVTVRMAALEHALALAIEDDGRGFEVERAAPADPDGPTLGLVGMTERARLLGGELTIHSSPGKGTQIAARLPWKRPDPA